MEWAEVLTAEEKATLKRSLWHIDTRRGLPPAGTMKLIAIVSRLVEKQERIN